jgi:hypothetical protein
LIEAESRRTRAVEAGQPEEATRAEAEIAHLRAQLATEALAPESEATSRGRIEELQAALARREAEIAERDAEIARLNAVSPSTPNGVGTHEHPELKKIQTRLRSILDARSRR